MPLLVDAGFGGTVADPANIPWTDISSYVDVVTGVSITRGASDEVSEIQPATCTMILDNDDGRFSSGKTSGAYWPNVKKNVPIRIAEAVLDTPSGAAPYPLAQLSDDFDDNRVNTSLWSGNFNGATETGGRARVPAAAGVTAGYLSARQWTLTGSWTTVRLLTVPSPTGATTATCTFMANSVTSGTRIGFILNTVNGLLQCRSEVGFSDAGVVNVTYSATTHAWLRVRESSGTVYWETSPNGYDWTVRRSAATPAWVGTDQVALQMAATRDAGATDYAEYDLVGATVHSRLWGMVNEWPLKWKGLQSTVTITCTDLFKWLNRQPALRPMLVEEILNLRPRAYYPLTEPDSSLSAGDLAGGGATSLTIQQLSTGGTLAFAGATGPAETGQSCPLFTPASASAGKYLQADLGPAAEAATVASPGWVELWIRTAVTGRTFLAVATADGTYQVVYGLQASTGLLEMRYTQDPTVPIANWADQVNLSSGNLADGRLHHLLIGLVTADLYVDGVASSNPFGTQQPMRTMYLGGFSDGRLWDGSIAHVALYARSGITAAALTPHYTAGATGFAGESASLRAQRLARYAGVASITMTGTAFDPQASQGPGGATALAEMQQVAATESARLVANKDSFGLTLVSRSVRYNPVPAVSLSYADLATDDVEMSDDDQKMVNTVVASRPGGATQRVLDQSARDTYGPYEPSEMSILKTTDNAVLDAANWTVSRYADPPPELREIPVEAYSTGAIAFRSLLDLDISGILNVTALPAQAPAPTQTVYIEGYTEVIKEKYHLITFHVSRSYNDSVWVLDDATYSVLGSTTRLAY